MIKSYYIMSFIAILIIVFSGYVSSYSPINPIYNKENKIKPPAEIEVYFKVLKYSKEYNIPEKYALRMLKIETGYEGPLHKNYFPAQTSSANAVGPAQVMVATARFINKDNVSIDKLRTDIDYNIRTSMKLIRHLYDIYGDWELVFGAYNTGKPIVNDYAQKIVK